MNTHPSSHCPRYPHAHLIPLPECWQVRPFGYHLMGIWPFWKQVLTPGVGPGLRWVGPGLSWMGPGKNRTSGIPLVVQWLRLLTSRASTAGEGTGSIPGQRTKIPTCHVVRPKNKVKDEWISAKWTERGNPDQRQHAHGHMTRALCGQDLKGSWDLTGTQAKRTRVEQCGPVHGG